MTTKSKVDDIEAFIDLDRWGYLTEDAKADLKLSIRNAIQDVARRALEYGWGHASIGMMQVVEMGLTELGLSDKEGGE